MAPHILSFTNHITVDDATRAASWYADAFGATERGRITLPNGKLVHLELHFGSATVMVADEFPEHGVVGPRALGGTYGAFYLHTDDVDALWERAVAAGAEVIRPLQDTFWGDRDGQVLDPFGHRWGLAQHVRDVPDDEMAAAAAAAFGG